MEDMYIRFIISETSIPNSKPSEPVNYKICAEMQKRMYLRKMHNVDSKR